MKIGLVSMEYPPQTGGGGIGTQTYLKAQGLSARGHEVHVVSASWDAHARTYNDGKAIVHRIPDKTASGMPYCEQSTYWLTYSVAVAEKLHELSQHVAFDVLQFPEYFGEGFVYQTDTFKYRKARYVVQCHGPLSMFAEHMGWPDRGGLLHRVGAFMERLVIHHSDLVLASSFCTAAFCAAEYDYPERDIHVIHSGIDTQRFHPRGAEQDERHPKVLFVGNFTRSKGFDLLVDAVLRLRARYPTIVLRMIGKGGDELVRAAKLRMVAAGAERNFELLGYVPYSELPGHYAWCDVLAGPSEFEPGPGNIYLEAMACGKPVIACNSGGAPEVVRDGVTGLLIPVHDSVALENGISRLADDGSLRRRLGDGGRSWVESNVSVDRYIDKVEALYRQVLGA